MALDAPTFIRQRPEFESAGTSLVRDAIADAALRVSLDEFGTRYDDALSLMAAHLLWDSPFGASMRRDGGQDAASPYLVELRALTRENVPRMAVL